MVSGTAFAETPNLVPVPPDWLERKAAQPGYSNRNINDIFWKKGPREADPGYIIVGPSTIKDNAGRYVMGQAERWLRKGRIPLYEYSLTTRLDKNGVRETIETNADKLTTSDRYYWLFANGGAHLFPVEQIVEHHWHINPPFGLTVDAFPQLAEWEMPSPYWCAACPTPNVPLNSEEQLITHLVVGHRQTIVQARDLIASYDPTVRPRGRSGLQLRRKAQEQEQVAAALDDAPLEQVATRRYICDTCGTEFSAAIALAGHSRTHASQSADAMNGRTESGSDA